MKTLNKKGFTLIELLAVIVILAVLMLMAAPSVLNIMNNARRNSFATEALSLLKAAQTKYAEQAVTSNASTMTFKDDGSGDNCSSTSPCKLDIEGGSAGLKYTITVSSGASGVVYNWNIHNGTYQATSGGANKAYPNDTDEALGVGDYNSPSQSSQSTTE